VFAGCNVEQTEEPVPIPETGILSIGNIDVRLRNATMAFGRAETTSDWDHIFPDELTINFENTATGVIYPLVFNPNDLSTANITLPYGFYRFSLSTSGGDLEEALLFNVPTSVFELTSPTYNLILRAVTTYGLVTLKNDLIANVTINTASESRPMAMTDDTEYFFMYVQNGTQITLDITESYSNTFITTTFSVDQLQHYHFYVQPPLEGDVSFSIEIGPFGYQETIFEIGRVRDIDGNSYRITNINGQIWMAQNLNTTRFRNGDLIPQATTTAEWNAAASAGTPVWAYYNYDPDNEAIYGKLYNWHAVNDSRGLAPDGYRIATNSDWSNLVSFLGVDPGGKLKQTGTTRWNAPNTGATNEFGFSALPGGQISGTGTMTDIRNFGIFWTSTQQSGTRAFRYFLAFNSTSVSNDDVVKSRGLSVRAVKN
jgi:uncharacterized protein (TIGR02145 family)